MNHPPHTHTYTHPAPPLSLCTYAVGTTGCYAYTDHLLRLNAKRGMAGLADSRLSLVHTPLSIPAWQACLSTHPDADFVRYITDGLQQGFSIGADPTVQLRSAPKNLQSALKNPEVVDDYLSQETASGNILGPFEVSTFPGIHINSFGVIPKKHQPGRWRLITDLSAPKGFSVNDAIDPALCSLSYVTVDEVATVAMRLHGLWFLAGKNRYKVSLPPNTNQSQG